MTELDLSQVATKQFALDLGAEINREVIKMVEILDQERKHDFLALSQKIEKLISVRQQER